MALEARILGDLPYVIVMTVGTIPDSIRVFPLVMALIAINSRFLMGLMDDIHVILPALGSNDHSQLGQISGSLFLAGNN